MSKKNDPGEARRQRMLRELRRENRDPSPKLAAAAGGVALLLVAAFAVIETQQATPDPRSAPVAAAKSQPTAKERPPSASPVRLLGSAASSGIH